MQTNTPNKEGYPLFKIFTALFFVAGVFMFGAFVGYDAGYDQSASVSASVSEDSLLQPVGVDFAPVWKSWHVINEKFVSASTTDLVSNEDKVWGIIQGLASSLDDPYTVFLPPEDNEIFSDDISGNFSGVGMEIGIRDSIVTVIAPLKGTPAYRAGVKSGDKIVKIDDINTDRMTIDRAVKHIRGEQGTAVVLTVAREGENEFLEIEIVRDIIEIPTIDTLVEGGEKEGGLREDGVFVIQLHNFSAVSPSLFQGALRSFVESGTKKLVLDLRGNPGGFLEASVDMASWFLPIGKIVVTEELGENQKPRIHRSRGYDIFNDTLEMIILVNRGSASASEILAGALQEHGVAQVVGETTFGKGSVQELVHITPETSLKITIARWLTPNGNSISNNGLEPDFMIELTPEDFKEGRDPQMEKAVELLTN